MTAWGSGNMNRLKRKYRASIYSLTLPYSPLERSRGEGYSGKRTSCIYHPQFSLPDDSLKTNWTVENNPNNMLNLNKTHDGIWYSDHLGRRFSCRSSLVILLAVNWPEPDIANLICLSKRITDKRKLPYSWEVDGWEWGHSVSVDSSPIRKEHLCAALRGSALPVSLIKLTPSLTILPDTKGASHQA